MAQTGCPKGTGTGGSGTKLPAEFSEEPFERGTVGMARAQSPDSGDSQFFIMFDEGSFLNGQYTVWGEVVSGMEFVDKIKRGEPPPEPDKIEKLQVAFGGASCSIQDWISVDNARIEETLAALCGLIVS